jgi:hypothetical protein
MPESILDRVIDLERAHVVGVCRTFLDWAEQRPGASVRDMVRSRANLGTWYMSAALGLDDAEVVRLLGEELKLSDRSILAAVSAGPGWYGDRIVKALDAAWKDDARVAGVLLWGWVDPWPQKEMSAAWGDDNRVRKALGGAWNDEARVFRALQKLEPKGASNV